MGRTPGSPFCPGVTLSTLNALGALKVLRRHRNIGVRPISKIPQLA
jgi:hypothetical protein